MRPISIQQLESAINRARQATPASGHEGRLSHQVGVLADIYGQLIFLGHKMFDGDSLDAEQRAALEPWLDADDDSPGSARAA